VAKLIILEGARTAGKSTAARALRETLKSSTLINMTGFPEDGRYGLEKIVKYYDAFLTYINLLDNQYTFILDRTFFTEMVFSILYKHYDFNPYYDGFVNRLIIGNHEIHFFLFSVNDEDIKFRLIRNKTDYFSTKDTIEEIIHQKKKYDDLVYELSYRFNFFNNKERFFHPINTSYMREDEVVRYIKDKLEIL